MSRTDHDSADVYPLSLELLGLADELSGRFPRRYAHLARELRTAATAVPRDLEGGAAPDASRTARVRSFRRAECAVTECATLLRTCERLRLGRDSTIRSAKAAVGLLVAAILGRIRHLEVAGSGH
ncbi:MAG: hypothetical protein ACF8XB_10790 [Planctomycetota bacterium JB042]